MLLQYISVPLTLDKRQLKFVEYIMAYRNFRETASWRPPQN